MSMSVGDLTARLGVELDDNGIVQKFRSQIRALEALPDPKVGMDTRAADSKIDQISARIQRLSSSSNDIRVNANTTGAEQSVSRLDSILSQTTRAAYTAQVNADIDGALADLQIMQAQLNRLDDRPAHVEVRADTDRAIGQLQELRREMGLIENDTVEVSTRMSGMSNVLGGIGTKALALGAGFGIAQTAMSLMGRAASFLKDAVWGANITLDQITIRINAFTKDTGETARILDDLRQKAADVGMPFLDLAEAVATIGPIAKQTNQPLDELLDTAILLSAINPQEGLPGAIFAIREALSGDWMSLMDRFNMPRSIINQMKEDGVPALEIINTLLRQQGVDMDMVGQMAGVADSRTKTLFSNLAMAAAQLGRPVFEAVSSVIDRLATYTSSNAFQEDLDTIGNIAKGIAELPPIKLVEVLVSFTVAHGDDIAAALGYTFSNNNAPMGLGYSDDVAKTIYAVTAGTVEYNEAQKEAVRLAGEHASAYQQFIDEHAYDPQLQFDQEELNRLAEEYFFQQQQIVSGEQRRKQAAEERAAAESQAQSDFQPQTSKPTWQVPPVSELSAAAQAMYEIAAAQTAINRTQDRLSEAYQIGLKIQSDYTAQGSEYAQQQSIIEEGNKILKDQLDSGQITQEQYNAEIERGEGALARFKGGQEDATLTARDYAIQNGELMSIQDQINEQFPNLVRGSDEYNKKLREAAQAAGISDEAIDGMMGSAGNLTGAIANELVPAILRLIEKLGELDGKHVTATVETKFITTGSPVGQVYGQQVSGGYIGVEEHAAGGYIDQPMVSMLGEEAPAHPEWVIPTNPARRGRAMDLWMQAGHSLGVPGFADGGGGRTLAGNTGGNAAGQPTGAIDWSWLFVGLDETAEDFAERAGQKFIQFFGNVDKLVDGSALRDAQQKLDELFTVRQIAIDTGASDAVIAGLDAEIAAAQSQVQAIGAVMGSDVIAGMAAELEATQSREKINESLQKTLLGLTSASDPFQKVQGLGDQIKDIKDAIAVAEAMGNTDVAAALRSQLEDVQSEYLNAQNGLTKMLQLGLIDDATIKEMAERGGEAFRATYDAVFGEGALAELQAGWSKLTAEQYSQLEAYVAQGGKLTDQMVSSIVKGMQDGAITIDQAMRLLGDQQGRFAKDQQIQLWQSLQSTEDELMQAIASGDQARIEAAQASYDALMALIVAYAEATGQTVEDVIGKWEAAASAAAKVQIPSVSIPSTSPPRFDSGGSVGGGGISINAALHLPSGKTINEWYAYEIEQAAALTPIGVV